MNTSIYERNGSLRKLADFCSAADRTKREAFLRRCQRLGYCSGDTPTIAEMFEEADDKLFSRALTNDNHVLQQYLTDRTNTQYNIRTRATI